MAYVYKVTISEGDKSTIHFDTSTGSSDSFSDANRCFSDLCFKFLSADGDTSIIVRLIENGNIKKEMNHSEWIDFRSGGKKKGKSKSKSGTPDKKSSKKTKISPDKNPSSTPVAVEEDQEGSCFDKFAYETADQKASKQALEAADEKVEPKVEQCVEEEMDVELVAVEEDTQQFALVEDSQEEVVVEDAQLESKQTKSSFFVTMIPNLDNCDGISRDMAIKEVVVDKDEPTSATLTSTQSLPSEETSSVPFRSLKLPVSLNFIAGGLELIIMRGDITTWRYTSDDESCTVVNAANERMLGGGGVDGAIHKAAGLSLREHCKKIPEIAPGVRCETGDAIITPSFNMEHVDSIIHTAGPVYNEDEAEICRMLLSNAYQTSLRLASSHGHVHVAFPALSCGVFGYPLEDAAEAALVAIGEFNEEMVAKPVSDHTKLRTVTFVMFEQTTALAWLEAAQKLGMKLKTRSTPRSNSKSSPVESVASEPSSKKKGIPPPSKGQFMWQVAAQKAKNSLATASMSSVVDAATVSKP